jgi:transposase
LAIKENVYAFDSTTIDLCLNVFWWAHFRKTKGAVKLHTLYDIKTSIPAFVYITTGKVHDVNGLDQLTYEAGGFYVMDKGYIDFKRLYNIHQEQAFFVTRAKDNLQFTRISSAKIDKTSNIICDQTIILKGITYLYYYENLRRIEYYDAEQKRLFVFLTNNFSLIAKDIALLYKYRWRVELFFKWIKQHLKITSFWGVSPNAVKTQVYIALITYTLVALIKSQLKTNLSTYEMLQILSASLFDKTHLNQLFQSPNYQYVKEQNCNQLKINLI